MIADKRRIASAPSSNRSSVIKIESRIIPIGTILTLIDFVREPYAKNVLILFRNGVTVYSHKPIIAPDIFDRVQEKLKEHCANRAKIRSNHPFANRLICGECGEFYGRKVWHNRRNTERYDVWYCNHKYKQTKPCKTPFLREEEIRAAFEKVISNKETKETPYSEELWRTSVETVTVCPDRSMKFLFSDGYETTVLP